VFNERALAEKLASGVLALAGAIIAVCRSAVYLFMKGNFSEHLGGNPCQAGRGEFYVKRLGVVKTTRQLDCEESWLGYKEIEGYTFSCQRSQQPGNSLCHL